MLDHCKEGREAEAQTAGCRGQPDGLLPAPFSDFPFTDFLFLFYLIFYFLSSVWLTATSSPLQFFLILFHFIFVLLFKQQARRIDRQPTGENPIKLVKFYFV